ncbi:MAG: LysR family transcriptional regulator [Erysipelotrichaceae bacterium]|nr:LysR family transcriptional regulator [Erysipelotrichaceae bacterium]
MMANNQIVNNMLDKKVIYFMSVVEEKSFSAAAKKLYLSQPNLSKQVTLLEKELNVTLFDRTGYRPVLTRAGEIYYNECKKLQHQIDDLNKHIQQVDTYEIKIGFTGLYQNRKIINAINEYKKGYPNIKISFDQYNFGDVAKSLINHATNISFGIESSFKYYQPIKYHVLYDYEICVICSFDHPLSKYDEIEVEQLQNEEFIILSQKYGYQFYQDFMDACKQDGLNLKIKKEVESFDSLVFDVSIGEGIAIVSSEVVRQGEVKVIPLKNSHHHSRYVIAYLDKPQDQPIQNLINSIFNYFNLYNK